MTALDKDPINPNLLAQFRFRFLAQKLPQVNFHCQKVSTPTMTLPHTYMPTPHVRMPIVGDHITYDELGIYFLVDEDLTNYKELHKWLREMGSPTEMQEFANISYRPKITQEGIYSDVSVMLLTNMHNANIQLTYRDAMPISLSGLEFNTTDTGVTYITAAARFVYTYYDIEDVT